MGAGHLFQEKHPRDGGVGQINKGSSCPGHRDKDQTRANSISILPVLRLPNITSKLVLLVLNCWRGKIKKFSLDNRTCPLTFCSQKYKPVSCTTQYKLRYSAVRDIFLPRKPVRPPTSHQLKGNIEMAWYR